MTAVTDPETGTESEAEPGSLAKLGWAAVIAFILVKVTVLIGAAQTGLHNDARTSNPNPGPQPNSPVFGIDNWGMVWTVLWGAIAVVIIAWALRASIRQRSLHWCVILFVAVHFAGFLDPVSNWATYTVIDPGMPHVPLSWPWFNHAPLTEPVISFLGAYPMYYITIALGIFWLYQRIVVPRTTPGSWVDRHPLLTLFGAAFLIGLPIDFVAQTAWMKTDLYMYTQALGPAFKWGNVTLPFTVLFFDPWMFAIVSVLIYRDDRGQSFILSRLAQRAFSGPDNGGRTSSGRLMAVGIAFMLAISVVPISFYTIIRVGNHAHPVDVEFPYPEAKVYDPYGELERDGHPGPFYK